MPQSHPFWPAREIRQRLVLSVVLPDMSFLSQQDRNGRAGRPYVVQSPVEIARLGPALRSAFERNSLPSDMVACLDKLDALTRTDKH